MTNIQDHEQHNVGGGKFTGTTLFCAYPGPQEDPEGANIEHMQGYLKKVGWCCGCRSSSVLG